jgi:hypothetical protein
VVDGQPTGLILNHSYGINDVFELECNEQSGAPIRLLRLRNPWGKSEFIGAWDPQSPELQAHRADVQRYISSLPPDEQFELDADDGTFLMGFEDWKDHFSTLFLNNDFPEDWTGVRFKSAWTVQNSGGLPQHYDTLQLQRYARNPQFLIQPLSDCEVMFSMQQTGGRLPKKRGVYSKYPFSDSLHYACVGVFELEANEPDYLRQFNKDRIKFLSPIKCERENAGRIKLQKGKRYVIVCSTERQGQTGEVYLSVYFNQYLRDVNIKRVFHPEDLQGAQSEEILPTLIPEEAEKLVNSTPQWKIRLVQDSLQWMMTDEDN